MALDAEPDLQQHQQRLNHGIPISFPAVFSLILQLQNTTSEESLYPWSLMKEHFMEFPSLQASWPVLPLSSCMSAGISKSLGMDDSGLK